MLRKISILLIFIIQIVVQWGNRKVSKKVQFIRLVDSGGNRAIVIVGLTILFGCSVAADIYTELPPQLAKYDASVHVHITSKAEARTVRHRIIEYLWPKGKLPTAKLPAASNVYDGQGPLPREIHEINAPLVARVDILDVEVDLGYHHTSYFLRPVNPIQSKRLVIFHQGHQGGLGDGIGTLANRLLKQGFSVLLMQMPVVGWNTDNTFKLPEGTVTVGRGTDGHNQLVAALEGQRGSSLRFFIEPVITGINYFIDQNPDYQDISMVGLSGGGWTVHIAAAVDPRINLSIPVAGSWPLYLRHYYPGSTGDAEQTLPALYKKRASWLDLYILGGYGTGRTQIQILNQFDTCCFYGISYTTYEVTVSSTVRTLGYGQWKCVLDSSHKKHQISTWAIDKVIEPALNRAKTAKE